MEQARERMHINNGFSRASKALGIAAIVSTFIVPVYLPLILGGIAIIIALLSRGKEEIDADGWVGITTGIVAISVNIAMMIFVIVMFLTNTYFRDMINVQYMQLYGTTLNSAIEKIIGGGFDLDMYLYSR